MEKETIEEYIEKLKMIEKGMSSEDENFSDDNNFISELDTLLSKLNTEIQGSQTSNTSDFSLKVKVKKLNSKAVIPTYSKDGDAGMDLISTKIISDTTNQITYGTDLSFEIPKGFVGLVFPRSSIRNYDLSLSNCVGVIDSGYRGEVQCTFNKIDENVKNYVVGDRMAQIIILPYPRINFIESDDLTNTERGDGGFGSSGK
jgi:dUTP pyrophosphatase